jgi:hypothetical protein
MFGPDHPRASGFAGTKGQADASLPGFGAHGTAGAHVFDRTHPAFVRIKALVATRQMTGANPPAALRALRRGRQYRRATAIFDLDFGFQGSGQLMAWSRVLNDNDVVIVVNVNGAEGRGSKVELDPRLHPPGSAMRVVCDTSRLGAPGADLQGGGAVLPIQTFGNNRAFVDVGVLGPAEVMVLV